MSTITVRQAEQQLKAVRAEAKRQECESANVAIQRLIAEGASGNAELERLKVQINDAQATRLKLNGLLMQARNNIAAYSAPLDPLSFPTAKDEAYRLEQLAAWKKRQQELLAKHRAAVERESVRLYAVKLQDRLERIRYEIQNQTAIAEGRRPGQLPEGGVFSVGQDILGHTDRRFD